MSMSMTQGTAARIADLASRVGALSAAMDDQARFYRDEHVDFGMDNLRQGMKLAAARAESAVRAGPSQGRAIERTVLCELMRGAIIAAAVLERTGTETWPTLQEAAADATRLLGEAAQRDPSLLAPPESVMAQPSASSTRTPAPFEEPTGWFRGPGDAFVGFAEDGIMLSAAPVAGEGHGWLARVGAVGVGIRPLANEAASEALRVHGTLFSPRKA